VVPVTYHLGLSLTSVFGEGIVFTKRFKSIGVSTGVVKSSTPGF